MRPEELPLGQIVHIYDTVRQAYRPFIVIRHGAPTAQYVGWENSVFLRQFLAFDLIVQNTALYMDSPIDILFQGPFLQALPEWLNDRLVEGRVPFATGLSVLTRQHTENGLLRKAFAMTIHELGVSSAANTFEIGANFGFFASNADRIVGNSTQPRQLGTGIVQHVRTPNITGNALVGVQATGGIGPSHALGTNAAAIPTIALPYISDIGIDENNILVHEI